MDFSRDAKPGLQSSLDLQVGRRVEVGVNMGGEFRWLRSRIAEEVRPDGRLAVAWPTDRGASVPARLGQSVVVVVANSDDALYSSEMVVEGGVDRDPAYLVLKPERPWQRAQRRQDVRLPVIVRPAVTMLQAVGGSQPIPTTITNISAGGLRLRSEHPLEVHDRVYVTFTLPGAAEIRAHLEVRHVEHLASANPVVWNAGCQFEDLRTADREAIVKFIFAQQRSIARRQRGLE